MNKMQFITVTKSKTSNLYITLQPISYDFYLLFLLFNENLSLLSDQQLIKKNNEIHFYKNSTQKCLVTSELFIHKNHGYIELFSMYDLKNNDDDLCLPQSPKFIMTAKNFINFTKQKQQILQLQPEQFFIVLDNQGHAHLTTNLQTLTKQSFFSILHKKLMSFFFPF